MITPQIFFFALANPQKAIPMGRMDPGIAAALRPPHMLIFFPLQCIDDRGSLGSLESTVPWAGGSTAPSSARRGTPDASTPPLGEKRVKLV